MNNTTPSLRIRIYILRINNPIPKRGSDFLKGLHFRFAGSRIALVLVLSLQFAPSIRSGVELKNGEGQYLREKEIGDC